MNPHSFHRIMFVDDCKEDNFVGKLTVQLSDFAQEVILQSSAQGALMYFIEHMDQVSELPELVFLDINMPLVDGIAFLREFERFPQVVSEKCKIIILSSSDHHRDKEMALGYPFVVRYITKPLTIETLGELKNNWAFS